MVFSTSDWRHRLFRGLLFLACLGAVSGGPIVAPQLGRDDLVPRQQVPGVPSTAAAATSATSKTRTRTQADATRASTQASTIATTVAMSATSTQPTSTSAGHTTTNSSSSSASSASSSSTSSSVSSHSTSTAATATATIQPSIFSSSSKYFGYAIGVLVVVCVFGFLLVVLFIRFIVQLFTKKPQPPPITTSSRAWRYSRDSDMDSAGPIPTSAHPTGQSELGLRHKDVGTSEMGERRAFLSTESVTLYPMPKFEEHQRYEDDSNRSHMRSFSSSSGSGTATPYVSRRPVSFLHSPPATHPAFIVDPGSQSGHSAEEAEVPAPHLLQAVPADSHVDTNSLLLARASASEAYRQQTRSSTGVSRAASTASAYSTQPPASIPPVPEVPPLWMLNGEGLRKGSGGRSGSEYLSPDMSAALTTMRGSRNGSVDSMRIPEGTTAPPTEEGVPPSTVRMMPGRAGWGRQAPTSVHGDDLYFLQH